LFGTRPDTVEGTAVAVGGPANRMGPGRPSGTTRRDVHKITNRGIPSQASRPLVTPEFRASGAF
jgi:hypothetical protein